MSDQMHYFVQIWGLVQGVGMRPFIYKMAKKFNLVGFVKNQGASVVINISGEKSNIDNFINTLTNNPPNNAKVDRIQVNPIESLNYTDFNIKNSSPDDNQQG